ncbi:MAG: hypothetical protein R2705_20065 [Ilumatobacteraceae bacterium]
MNEQPGDRNQDRSHARTGAMRWVRRRVERPMTTLADPGSATRSTLAHCGIELAAGSEVAIAVGSRGIRDLVVIVSEVIDWVRAAGATPFLVPAMGSHGGATASGQRAVLESYGLGELGVEIRATMDVVPLEQGGAPVPVVFDAEAARAAATIVINRVKPHTDFHGPVESGVLKMCAIGLGKRVQAERLHAYGLEGLRDLMPRVARQVVAASNVVLGVGIVENARDETMLVEAMPAAAIESSEARLLDLARRAMPVLPVDDLDVLLVDRMGKDVSGVGMDTNVIGRLMIAGAPDPVRPRIAMIGCHSLTPASHGNATGVGLADVVTRQLADAIDHEATRTNIVTSGFLLRGKLPVVADTAADLWSYCLRGAHVVEPASVRAMRIVDTLHTEEVWVTEPVAAELDATPPADATVIDLGPCGPLHDDAGALRPFTG